MSRKQRGFDEPGTHRQLAIGCGCFPIIGATLAPVLERAFFGRHVLTTLASILFALGVAVCLSLSYFLYVWISEWWEDRG